MGEAGIDISSHYPKMVDQYINDEWDYVITVCEDANETCPVFIGKVKHRLHMGFEDPSGKAVEEYAKTLALIEETLLPIIQKELCD